MRRYESVTLYVSAFCVRVCVCVGLHPTVRGTEHRARAKGKKVWLMDDWIPTETHIWVWSTVTSYRLATEDRTTRT